jgi:hypothetical protein
MFSPVRMAGQTACPEESLARARKRCHGMNGLTGCCLEWIGGRVDLKVEI